MSRTGRSVEIVAGTDSQAPMELIERFKDTLNRHDPDGLMADVTDDCIFELLTPDGKSVGRCEGYQQVRNCWAAMPETMPNYRFETEDIFATSDRCAYRGILRFDLPDGGTAECRGAEIYTIRDGKISEKYTCASLF